MFEIIRLKIGFELQKAKNRFLEFDKKNLCFGVEQQSFFVCLANYYTALDILLM